MAFGFGVAIIMARKTKKVVINNIHRNDSDLDELVEKVAERVAEKFAVKLAEVLSTGQTNSYKSEIVLAKDTDSVVELDERIIPAHIELDDVETSLEGIAKEEVDNDTGLAESKSRLARLFKKPS